MKRMFTLFLLIVSNLMIAQTLTQSFNEPVVGDVDKSYRLDTSAYTSGLPINMTGTNCVWNFTNLNGTFPMVVDSFIAPSAALGATAYPNATFVQHRDLLYTFYKSTASPQQTELFGAYSPSLSLTFTNSAIIAAYPVNYGYNQTDPVSGSFKYNNTTGACNGNITITAGGVGTANFANNVSIQNVLCLKSVEILTLSVGIFPFGTFNQTILNYYMPGKKFPILNVNYTTYQLIAGSPTVTAYVYGSNSYFTVAGVNQSAFNPENNYVYPNPFHDYLFLNSKTDSEGNEYLLYDSNGRLVEQTKSLAAFHMEQLHNGLYILEIKNKLGSSHQKIIKE